MSVGIYLDTKSREQNRLLMLAHLETFHATKRHQIQARYLRAAQVGARQVGARKVRRPQTGISVYGNPA
jgi:hypothetical protein